MEGKYAGPVACSNWLGYITKEREKTPATCWYNFNGDFIINVCKEGGREGGRVSSGQTYEGLFAWRGEGGGGRENSSELRNIMGTSPGARDNLSVMKVKI